VEEALRELQRSGFDMKKLSRVGKDYHTEVHIVYNSLRTNHRFGFIVRFFDGTSNLFDETW
jgi:hypothetical protein